MTAPATAPILSIESLTVNFDGFKALNNLTFSLDPGELRVVIGPNGAGKTTFLDAITLDAITGKVRPTQGDLFFKGRSLKGLAEYEISHLGIGRKFQTPRVYQNLTVRQNKTLIYRATSARALCKRSFGSPCVSSASRYY
jgi:urea transport system ATP-binding protein